MNFLPAQRQLYQDALLENWNNLVVHCHSNAEGLMFPITLYGDSSFHMAVYSENDEPLKSLLNILADIAGPLPTYIMKNSFGDTPLHEAVIAGNIKAVRALVERDPESITITNKYRETPLFRAAAFGETDILWYFLSTSAYKNYVLDVEKNCLQSVHRQRDDGASILHVAIEGTHFETALLLLKCDSSLPLLYDKSGKTSLHALANMPSAFLSGYDASIFKKFIYNRITVDHDEEDDHAKPCVNSQVHNLEGGPIREGANPKRRKSHDRNQVHDLEGGPIRGGTNPKTGESHENSQVLDLEGGPIGKGPNPQIRKSHDDSQVHDLEAGPIGEADISAALHDLQRGPIEEDDISGALHDSERGPIREGANPQIKKPRNKSQAQNSKGNICASFTKVFRKINIKIWNFIRTGWPAIETIWEDKKRHYHALKLANLIIETDDSWLQNAGGEGPTNSPTEIKNEPQDQMTKSLPTGGKNKAQDQDTAKSPTEIKNEDQMTKSLSTGGKNKAQDQDTAKSQTEGNDKAQNPLFIAASAGIKEIVKAIIENYPQAVDILNDDGQNVLHVAVMHRQRKIFRYLNRWRIPLQKMKRRIDKKGYTLLHQVADTKYYVGGTRPSPALQLQEELEWFEDVRVLVPSYYAMHRDNVQKQTGRELFNCKHREQLKSAQEWIKDTSQSCSAVAVLVATVVFAAAYTAPGGYERGIPIFLHRSFFVVFTVMDVISLACSLTSVVMFLSILTSPFEYNDFLRSIPRKLTFGFTLLFFSIVTTMIAFGSTILLTIQMEKNWTASLISIAAFLPVSVFALVQFRLYLAILSSMKDVLKAIRGILPSFCVPTLCFKKMPCKYFSLSLCTTSKALKPKIVIKPPPPPATYSVDVAQPPPLKHEETRRRSSKPVHREEDPTLGSCPSSSSFTSLPLPPP